MKNSDMPHSIVWELIGVARLHKTLFDEALQSEGIHGSQHRTLRIIADADTPPSQKQIAQQMDISTASVAVTLKKLEAGGYITRKTSSPDNRRNEIIITDKGRAVLKSTCTVMSQVDTEMFEGFNDKELKELKGYLDRINSNLRKEQVK